MESNVLAIRHLTDSTFVLRFDRKNLSFEPGQHLHVGLSGCIDMREYSVYSGAGDPYLEVLVKEVDDGFVSKQLHGLKAGSRVSINGPYGFFLLKDDFRKKKHYFIATGTGVAPYRSFIRSQPDIDYLLLHGTREASERYEYTEFDETRYIACLSGMNLHEPTAGERVRNGRVTDFLRDLETDAYYYLCGNCDMIYEVYDILKSAGVASKNIFAEVYF